MKECTKSFFKEVDMNDNCCATAINERAWDAFVNMQNLVILYVLKTAWDWNRCIEYIPTKVIDVDIKPSRCTFTKLNHCCSFHVFLQKNEALSTRVRIKYILDNKNTKRDLWAVVKHFHFGNAMSTTQRWNQHVAFTLQLADDVFIVLCILASAAVTTVSSVCLHNRWDKMLWLPQSKL